MKLVVVGDPPVELTAFLARRRALGQDSFDEVWEGDYHVVPAPHSWHGQVDSELAALPRPAAKSAGLFIRWFLLAGNTYEETGASPLLGVTTADLVAGIDWPG